jgi:hypothetical protein
VLIIPHEVNIDTVLDATWNVSSVELAAANRSHHPKLDYFTSSSVVQAGSAAELLRFASDRTAERIW